MYFEKTENKRMKYGIELIQIRYTKDYPGFNAKAGDLGGWVSERTFLEQNGKWFLHENAEVYDGEIHGGVIWNGVIWNGVILGGKILGGKILGGWIYGGEIRGGEIHGGEIHGGYILGGEIRGGKILGGVIRGGEIRGGYIDGGEILGGVIRGGEILGGRIDGDLPSDFGRLPYLDGGRYPVNFAGYSKTGERKFACGCQVYEESKWTPELMKTLARQNGFAEQQRIQAEHLFETVKMLTPKKTSNVPEKTLNRDTKTGRFLKKS